MSTKFINTGQLPDDPFKMPPPHWRSPGIIFQLTISLEEIIELLVSLLDVHPEIDGLLMEYYDRNPDPNDDDEEFGEICNPLWELESKIILKSELSIFMASIQAEDDLNQVITFNLHKDIADTIEKLSPPEKLIIISANLTSKTVKGSKPYNAIRALTKWRNSYAHGHCTDRPTKSLRHNHLIAPEEYPSVPKAIENMKHQLQGYLDVSSFLRKISRNKYTRMGSTHNNDIQEYMEEIDRYQFTYENEGMVYDLIYK